MTLSISSNNVLVNQTPTVVDAGIGETPLNISDPDHSLNYTSGTSTGDFSVSYGAQSNISYVGVSGHTAATASNATVELRDGALLIDSILIKRNHNIMFTFPEMSFTDLKVIFLTTPNNYQMTVSFIAAGTHLSIPTGEQAGYNRAWLTRGIVQRTSSNSQNGPISSIQKNMPIKVTLSLPNELETFTAGDWQDLVDFSFEQPFFIKEQESKPESTYLCSNPVHGVKAHAQTRKLDVITLKYTAFNGL